MPGAGREGICSRFRQSDVCLACIAFASWVLRSADPESADAWKAGMKVSSDVPLTTVCQRACLEPQTDFSLKQKESMSICDQNQTSLESPFSSAGKPQRPVRHPVPAAVCGAETLPRRSLTRTQASFTKPHQLGPANRWIKSLFAMIDPAKVFRKALFLLLLPV